MNSATTHPGWLLISPDQRPYAWYQHQQPLSEDEVSAMQRFEPDDRRRARMLQEGWKVRPGSGIELIAVVPSQVRVPA